MTSQIKLIVGLGNCPEYAKTRHNAGPGMDNWPAGTMSACAKSKFFGHTARILWWTGRMCGCSSRTPTMNLSGKTLAALARFYQIARRRSRWPTMSWTRPGIAKFKQGGGHGGHNGLGTSSPGWAATITS